MSTSVSPLKAMEGFNLPANISNETMHEFLTIWMNMELNKNVTKKPQQNETTPDNCLHYCAHDIRDFFTKYPLYHGYITLVVSINYIFLIEEFSRCDISLDVIRYSQIL